ncbi:MAG: QueT transporter family protein [Ruminococcus sp.]|nr:QueT transporter family protein [Candidatus Apopatosoma intestinale]
MKNNSARGPARAAIIAALYVVLTGVSAVLGLDKGVIQFRFSEALAVLPAFCPAAIPGLFVGCFLFNQLFGGAVWDILFGSFATLVGAVGTFSLRKHRFLAPIPPILANTVIIPPILYFVYGTGFPYLLITLTVFVGEAVSCGGLGTLLTVFLNKNEKTVFRD